MNHNRLMETQADCLDLRDCLTEELTDVADELTSLNQRLLAGEDMTPANYRETAAVRLAVRLGLACVGLNLVRQQIAKAQEGN